VWSCALLFWPIVGYCILPESFDAVVVDCKRGLFFFLRWAQVLQLFFTTCMCLSSVLSVTRVTVFVRVYGFVFNFFFDFDKWITEFCMSCTPVNMHDILGTVLHRTDWFFLMPVTVVILMALFSSPCCMLRWTAFLECRLEVILVQKCIHIMLIRENCCKITVNSVLVTLIYYQAISIRLYTCNYCDRLSEKRCN